MAALPSPTQVAGAHQAIFESYYNYVDPKGVGYVGSMEAARFLKKSGLSDVVLSRIWDLSDPGGRGCLDKTGMFIALKLVSLAQAGRDINMSNINMDMPPPKMGDIPLPKPKKPPLPMNTPLITSLPPSAVDWTIKQEEREKYDKLFESLQPINGLIPGQKVRGVFMDSKLPLETLGKIWELADQDKDGMLDRGEFLAAMHLVYKALEKHAIPNVLPPELMPQSKRKGSSTQNTTLISGLDGVRPNIPQPVIPSISPVPSRPVPMTVSAVPIIAPAQVKPLQSTQPATMWVITPEEKAKSDILFIKSDMDKDGFVSGHEIKDVFLQSGVPQQILAHIWGLCDINQTGKLNNEQFALAMWLISRSLNGINPPPTLTPEMIPPKFRNTKQNEGPTENNNTCYSNPELEMISKDIQELAKEKYALESEIAQKEADIKIKSGEIKSLQSELDTLAATLKQLENQKGEALKRLGDLKAQRSSLDNELEEVHTELDGQTVKVEKLRVQASEQADVISVQEAELNSKKEQLESLKKEEQHLEQIKNDNAKKLDGLSNNLQSTQLSISQAKAVITQLEEQTRQMNDAISSCDSAIASGDTSSIPDTALRINPDFRDPEYKNIGLVNGSSEQNGFHDDPFSKQNGHSISSQFDSDPFSRDPFKGSGEDAFSSNDPFKNQAFSASNDAFSSFDNFPTNTVKADPFAAFPDTTVTSTTPEPDKDPFGCDPFAVLHAPTRDGSIPNRSPSPSPALPPKKAKPPRPAPPRPNPPAFSNKKTQDPFNSETSDPFGSGGGFADFADFDSKFSNKSSTRKPTSGETKALDFTDDPFQNYRYADTQIEFDDDYAEIDMSGTKDDSFDPFGLDGRQSVPLPNSEPLAFKSGRLSAPPFSVNKLTLEEQLTLAAKESLRIEEKRKHRQLREQADFELAIALSKADNK